MEKARNLKETLQEDLNSVEVHLFGSRARGDFYPDSDYDLAIVSPAFTDHDAWERYDRIRRDVREVFGSTPVDVVCYTPEEFEDGKDAFLPHRIDKEGQRA
jgi:predicted nucleotidyltransferase